MNEIRVNEIRLEEDRLECLPDPKKGKKTSYATLDDYNKAIDLNKSYRQD